MEGGEELYERRTKEKKGNVQKSKNNVQKGHVISTTDLFRLLKYLAQIRNV